MAMEDGSEVTGRPKYFNSPWATSMETLDRKGDRLVEGNMGSPVLSVTHAGGVVCTHILVLWCTPLHYILLAAPTCRRYKVHAMYTPQWGAPKNTVLHEDRWRFWKLRKAQKRLRRSAPAWQFV